MIHRTLVIVGAGPAGMSAAIAAAEAGLEPTVIDENAQVGGQIYRQAPVALGGNGPGAQSADTRRGAELRHQFENFKGRIDLRTNTAVWGIFDGKRVGIASDAGWQMIEAEHLVLAPGAYEYVPPFVGWTLPGVMTPGCAQALVKTMQILPGKRALVVGTGPFLLVVANQLADAGVEVVGIVEAARRIELIRALPGLFADWGLLREGWRYLRRLKRAGIPIHYGHVILEARGDEEVQEAVFAPCDAQWRPDRSRARCVAVDTLCVGYGFVPRTQLAQLAGCRMRFADQVGGWVPEVGEDLQTTVPGVWVAGDGAGVAGALVARLQGRLVGLTIALRLGALDNKTFDGRRREISRHLTRMGWVRAALDRVSCIRSGLTSLATAGTVVCRCEELMLAEADEGIASGGTDIRTLKVMTRMGMGPCQGMMCWPAMARYVAARTGKSVEEIGPVSVRPPIKPLCLGVLASTASIGMPTSATN